MGSAFSTREGHQRELSWHAEGICFGAEGLFPVFSDFVEGREGGEGLEALGLLQEAGLGGQRHQGRGQAPEAHPRAEVEVRGGE